MKTYIVFIIPLFNLTQYFHNRNQIFIFNILATSDSKEAKQMRCFKLVKFNTWLTHFVWLLQEPAWIAFNMWPFYYLIVRIKKKTFGTPPQIILVRPPKKNILKKSKKKKKVYPPKIIFFGPPRKIFSC